MSTPTPPPSGPPASPEEIRALFQEVTAPPGVARWRQRPAVVEPEPIYLPPSHRARVPGQRPRRTGFAIAASAIAVAAVLGAVPVTIQLLAGHHDSVNPGADRASATASTTPPTFLPAPVPPPSGTPTTDHPSATGTASASGTGWPDARSAGVPDGTSLRTHTGDLTVTTAGSVVDGLLVTGSIIVEAPNVTIRNTRVAPSRSVYWVIRQAPGASNLLIEDSELAGGGVHIGVNQEADTLTVRRTDISGVDTAVSLGGNRGTVQDCYLHDVRTGVGAGTHGSNIAITHNAILSTVPGEAAIGFADRNTLTGVTVEDNLLAGGNYTFYGGSGAGLAQQITVRGNHFSRAVAPNGGRYGPVAAWADTSTTVWTGNVWDDTGAPVRA